MISKRAALYVDHPVAGERCHDCTMFRAPNRCTLVSGAVSPDGHCQFWEPKETVRLFADVIKSEPAGPAAVHVPTALGNQQPRRRSRAYRPFLSVLGEPRKAPSPAPTVGPRPAKTATSGPGSAARPVSSAPRTSGPTPVSSATTKRTRPRWFSEMITGPADVKASPTLNVTPTVTATTKRYATTADLPKPVRDRFKGKPKKLRQWMHVWNGEYNSHGDEKRAFATAWAAVQKRDMAPPMAGEKGRVLHPLNDHAYHVPFAYDPHFWGSLTAEDEPRFLGAITHPRDLPKARVRLAPLRAIQNRVNADDIERHVADPSKKRPVIVKFRGNHYIGDGHDRLTARWLRGKKTAKVRLFDLDSADTSPQNKAWTTPFRIEKADPDKQQLFGWASVVTKGGVPIVDKQDDIIPVDELEKAAYDFVIESRRQGDMHARTEGVGKMIESCVFTAEKQKALGIDLGMEGWWVGFACDCKELWKDVRSGRKLEFSIGGAAVPEKVA